MTPNCRQRSFHDEASAKHSRLSAGSHYPGYMAASMRKVLQWPHRFRGVGSMCFRDEFGIV